MDSTVRQVSAFTFIVTDAGLSLCSNDSSEQTGMAELLDWDCFCLTDIFQKKKRNPKPNCLLKEAWPALHESYYIPATSLTTDLIILKRKYYKNMSQPASSVLEKHFMSMHSFTSSPMLSTSTAGECVCARTCAQRSQLHKNMEKFFHMH